MVTNNFIFYENWMDGIEQLPIDTQDKILADIVRYGTGRRPFYDDSPEVASMVTMTKGLIDRSKQLYKQKVEGGEAPKTNHRPKVINDDLIEKLANQGYRSQEIANELGCSKSAIDHSDGWRRRKK